MLTRFFCLEVEIVVSETDTLNQRQRHRYLCYKSKT
jgi:hypothetical protein